MVLSRLLFDHPEGKRVLYCVESIGVILARLLGLKYLSSWYVFLYSDVYLNKI